MLKAKDLETIKKMGFVKDGCDYVYRGKTEDGELIKLFTIYVGSLYLRSAKTSYSNILQFKCIFDWTKNGYIEWEE